MTWCLRSTRGVRSTTPPHHTTTTPHQRGQACDSAILLYGYDGNVLTKTDGSATTNFSYDRTNRLAQVSFEYNARSQITALVDACFILSYTTPTLTRQTHRVATFVVTMPADRLTFATNSAQPNESYAFDGVGNRTSSHLSASYNYQPFNKLTSTARATYTYDNNGNLLTKTNSSGTSNFSYDGANRLKQVTLPGGLTVNYKYDALGRLIQRTTSAGANERYVYDGADVVLDLNADSSVATSYLNGPGIDNHLRQTSATTGVSYFLADHLGSTAALANGAGNIVEQETYDSFGNSVGSTRTRYGYTGRERDPDTGLMYYRARFYDPQIGRFLGEDPIGFGGGDVNLYGYVWNNPGSYRDPLGLDGWGNDTADYLDRKIDVARQFWHYNNQEWVANGINESVAQAAHGVADLFRVGSGVGNAINDPDDNGYGRAANIARDIVRATAIFELLGGPAARIAGRLEAASSGPVPKDCECEISGPRIKEGSSGGETAGRPFPDDVRQQALAEDPSQTCVFCRGQGGELDHAIPRSKGGNILCEKSIETTGFSHVELQLQPKRKAFMFSNRHHWL